MTVQDYLEWGAIYNRFHKTEWKEGTIEEITRDYPFIGNKVSPLNRYSDKNTHVAILKSLLNEKTYHIYLFTEKRSYSIVVTPDYIGASSSLRAWEPLENWHRSHDLVDGKATEETFNNIILAILADELIRYDDGSTFHVCAEEVQEA